MLHDNHAYQILIIEDNLGDFVLISDYLYEYLIAPTIIHAKNYKEATELLNKPHKIDAIFLDLSLSDMEGEKLISSMLTLSNSIPIIILTGYSDIKFTVKAISLGISDYLIKDELNSAILYKSLIYNIERKKTMLNLEDSQKRYSDLFQLTPQPMWVYDCEDLKFIQVNKAAIKHYGYSEKEFKKMSILELLPKNGHTKTVDHKKLMKLFDESNKHIKKNKEIIDVTIHSNLFTLNEKNCKIVIVNDITEKIHIEKSITREIIKAQENERHEIGAELHDNVCQILASSQFDIEILKLSIDPSKLAYLNHFNECVNMALNEIRNLSHQLTPAFIHDMTIEEAFQKLFKTFSLHEKFNIFLEINPIFNEELLSIDLKLNFFRILQEQLRNIIKYSLASQINVKMYLENKQICFEIKDNGIGFNKQETSFGIGFSNMKKRVEIFSGEFEIYTKNGQGCRIVARIPYK